MSNDDSVQRVDDPLEPRHRDLLNTLEEVFKKWPETRLGAAVVYASDACDCPEVFDHCDVELNDRLRWVYLVDEGELEDEES